MANINKKLYPTLASQIRFDLEEQAIDDDASDVELLRAIQAAETALANGKPYDIALMIGIHALHNSDNSPGASRINVKHRPVNNNKNSSCGSARLEDLDWSRWFTDGGESRLYLHVWHRDGESVHRVNCRHSFRPRLSMDNGQLAWLIDERFEVFDKQ